MITWNSSLNIYRHADLLRLCGGRTDTDLCGEVSLGLELFEEGGEEEGGEEEDDGPEEDVGDVGAVRAAGRTDKLAA